MSKPSRYTPDIGRRFAEQLFRNRPVEQARSASALPPKAPTHADQRPQSAPFSTIRGGFKPARLKQAEERSSAASEKSIGDEVEASQEYEFGEDDFRGGSGPKKEQVTEIALETKYGKELDQLHSRISELNRECEELRSSKTALETTNASLTEQLSRKEDLLKMIGTQRKAEGTEAVHDGEVAKLKNELTDVRQKNATISVERDSLRKEVISLRDHVRELEEKLGERVRAISVWSRALQTHSDRETKHRLESEGYAAACAQNEETIHMLQEAVKESDDALAVAQEEMRRLEIALKSAQRDAALKSPIRPRVNRVREGTTQTQTVVGAPTEKVTLEDYMFWREKAKAREDERRSLLSKIQRLEDALNTERNSGVQSQQRMRGLERDLADSRAAISRRTETILGDKDGHRYTVQLQSKRIREMEASLLQSEKENERLRKLIRDLDKKRAQAERTLVQQNLQSITSP